MARRFSNVLAVVVAAATVASGCSPPPPAEVIPNTTPFPIDEAAPRPIPPDIVTTTSSVPLPTEVYDTGQFDTTDDGALVFTWRSAPESPQQVAIVNDDGSGFTCVTCATSLGGVAVGNPKVLDDQRIFLQSPPNNRLASSFSYLVLECAPSLWSCTSSTVKLVRGLVTSLTDAAGTQDRYFHATGDGSGLLWTRIRNDGYQMLLGELTDAGPDYEMRNVRIVNPVGANLNGDATARRLAAAWYEAKDISEDGRYLAFSGSVSGSMNYDNYVMDLTTGRSVRLSSDPDWDENVVLSPDSEWFVGGTSSGQNRQAAWGNVPRPPFIDAALVGPLSNFFLPRVLPGFPDPGPNGKLERRLLEMPGQRSGWLGQPFDTGGDGMWAWRPDGSGLVSVRELPDGTPAVQTVTFIGLAAGPAPTVGPAVDPTWAPRLEEYPNPSDVNGAAIVAGPAGGTATITRIGTALFGEWSVRYQDYSDDGCSFLNGSQSTVTFLGIFAQYREATTVTGCHSGFTNGSVDFAGVDSTGSISSEYDGRVFSRSLPFRVSDGP